MQATSLAFDLGPLRFDLPTVLRQIRTDLRDDWFPDPRTYQDMIKSGHVEKLILKNFQTNHGSYRPSQSRLLNIPKPNFTLRYALETSITDRILYHGIVAFLAPFYDPLLPWNVISHRIDPNPRDDKNLFQPGIRAWQHFRGLVRERLDGNAVLLSTDLANYFEHISISKLRDAMLDLVAEVHATPANKAHIRSHLEILFGCLKYWCHSEQAGLPQNRDASSFLANMYMLPVDREMLAHGYEYFRYMDDIKIVCPDISSARLALKRLSIVLRKLDLSLNSAKTRICEPGYSEAQERSLDLGSTQFQQIVSAWETRSIKPISRSFPALKQLTKECLEARRIDSREFRFCIARLDTLARCREVAVPDEYFAELTPLIIDSLISVPAATDQLVKYLRAVALTDNDVSRIVEILVDDHKNFYTWQAYRLWMLLAQKNVCNAVALEYARKLLSEGKDLASTSGAVLYLGALGSLQDRVEIAKAFGQFRSFLGQRSALLAVQELPFEGSVSEYVRPNLRDDLQGVYRELKRFKGYVDELETVSLTEFVDRNRHYD